ncbi:hypothetical protein P692DRAFT_201868136 [Suillus brevipes Sb2]|nr:hypothetical protein P692DRAFT_201868136 [Suillus brevipes Sb2]
MEGGMMLYTKKFVFPFINICATSNTSSTLPEYLNDVVKTHRVTGDLVSWYRVLVFTYSWWKDHFDLIPFEIPHHITLKEVQELYQAHAAQMRAGYISSQMSTHPWSWLSRKTDKGRIALEEMTRLKSLVDNLNDAMAVSQQLLDAGWMNEDED